MVYNFINYAGVISLLQAVIQVIFNSISIAQYFCAIDFLNNNERSVLLKILYYINPDTCGNTVNIGNAIQGIPNQAFVLFRSEPVTSTRTYIFSVTSLVLGCIWAVSCCLLLAGGARNQCPRTLRWPWITATVCICAVDVVASVTYANDSFHTKSLDDMIAYIGATASGTGGAPVDTAAIAWIMVLVYSRCVLVFVINVVLTVRVAMHENENEADTTFTILPPTMPLVDNPIYVISDDVSNDSTISQSSENSQEKLCGNIPRANLSQAYQKMKEKLLAPTQADKSRQKHEIALELARNNLETRADNPLTNRANHEIALELRNVNPHVEDILNSPMEQQPWSYTATEPFRKRETVPRPDYTADRARSKVCVMRSVVYE